jgi:predicted acyltransferase
MDDVGLYREAMPAPPSRPERLASLDAFRGLTVAAMVLVNNPGTWRAVYPPLRHAEWHGWTLTDVIFPAFLFVVGVAVPLALGPRVETLGSAAVVTRVLRRSLLIFALGIVLNGFPDFPWATMRIPGVLQRIAVCYLAAALLFLATTWRTQAVVASALLVTYWIVMTLVPVPGYGAGNLNPEGNLAAYLDRALLGPHVWRAARVYDPEGVLSTAPALATTLAGVLVGIWLRRGWTPRVVAGGLTLAGIGGLALGELWGRWFPVNKALWTSSYAVLMAGLATLGLAACYWAIEVRGYRRWAVPFRVFGVNALALFFLSTLAARALVLIRIGPHGSSLQSVIYDRVFAPWATPVNASLAYAIVYVFLWWLVMWVLDRRGIHLRV